MQLAGELSRKLEGNGGTWPSSFKEDCLYVIRDRFCQADLQSEHLSFLLQLSGAAAMAAVPFQWPHRERAGLWCHRLVLVFWVESL